VTPETCVAKIRMAVASLNQGDIPGYLSRFGSASTRWVDGVSGGFSIGDIEENLRRLASAFEDLHLDEELLFGTDRYVCAHWRMHGCHSGNYLGIPPTGQVIDVQTCEVYEFHEGLVVKSWVHGEVMALFRQIGESSDHGGPR
jgi:predicted ester cyclase